MPKHILVVDDDETIAKNLKLRLDSAGYIVTAVGNGFEAIGRFIFSFESEPIHAILLDVKMPEITGLDVLAAIRKEEEFRGIKYGDGVPIIMITGLVSACIKAFNRGCDDYLLKPYDSEKLLGLLKDKIVD